MFINIKKSKTTKLVALACAAETVQLNFNISQHSPPRPRTRSLGLGRRGDENLIKSLVDYLGIALALACAAAGKVFVYPKVVSFNITSLDELDSKLLPFLAKYSIQGVKLLDYFDFVKVVRLIKNKTHLTAEGLDIIRSIKEGMNKKRS